MSTIIELAQTGKRDHLKLLEKKYQALWASQRLFEVNAPSPSDTAGLTNDQVLEKYPKWFGTYPYPYMNGSLHLGHAFTISKVEFGAGYQRMLGKRVLFPHGFHVTGMPIKASADKIVREIELFGPDFERFVPPKSDEPSNIQDASVDKAKATKGKVAAKSTGLKYQFQIMETLGVPRSEIKKFADTQHWLDYFIPIAMEDNNVFGSRIDWRRSFLTTPANPYYDSFVRWQMNKLHTLGKIKFGERYTIYSPKDGQPCMDHDRQDGEGLGPQEYTAIKLVVKEWSATAKELIKDKVGGRQVYLVAATLRPETMYGQTNCFVSTSIKYGIFAINDNDAYLCTYRAARNMAFQGIPASRGEINQLLEIEGSKIIGTKVGAPFSLNPEVYVLPMENVLATKGTGVVTSVPSDSPDDYQTLTDLRKKPAFYNIDPAWASIDPVPILTTPYGDLTAPAIVKSMKIQSQKDTKQLAEAKDLAYKEGFYNGVLLVGEFKGESIQDAKPKVRTRMIEDGLAFAYAEPEGLVTSRSSDECVVALMDQWYLDYGEKEWRAQTEKLVARMRLYSQETRNALDASLAWLNQWACARTYGLGSPLPWDPAFLVESLSDSTIYMAYYTVAQLLHENSIDGSHPGPLGITPEQMSDEVWEYILCNGPFPSPSPLTREKADALKHEFNYFYPLDLRTSGKDLTTNHLSFLVYNHVAIFPEDKLPLGIRTNGHITLNGQKMSKSTGNSMYMRESVEKFGADSTRLSLADAGDGVEDANFDEKTANANILRIHTLLAWCEEMINEESNLRQGSRTYHDCAFEEEINYLINVTQSHYEAMNFKDALKYGFYELQTARDWYREVTSDIGMHGELVRYWIEVAALLATPIAPHFAEHIWTTILKKPTSVQLALWPTPPKPVDATIIESIGYLRSMVKTIRDSEIALAKKMAKSKGHASFDPKKPKSVWIYVATSFPEWQNQCVQVVKEIYSKEDSTIDDGKLRELMTRRGLLKDKRAMPFVQAFKKRIAQFGATTAFRRTLPFSEIATLTEILPYLNKTLDLVDAEVMSVNEARSKGGPGFTKSIIEASEPGSPTFEYRNV